ncbi:MAG: ABC transporter permease [Dehalococcoidia bacterium]|nr:ABC transporter permease [Dehalococcoidia bacterium]
MPSSRFLPSSELLWRLLRILAFYALLVVAWEAVAKAEIWSPFLFPAPEKVFDALRNNIESGVLFEALRGTMKRLLVGYGISFVIGMALGLFIASWKWADETVGGIVLGLQSLPSIVWLPMAVLWFGLSERGIIFVVLMGSTFSIALSARAGIRALPPLLARAAGTLGASRLQMYRYVVLPAMIPAMIQGMKQGWSFAWRSLMAAELLLSVGIGHQLQIGRDLNNISMVFAIMLVIVAVGVAVGLLFSRAEAWVHERWGFAAG